jgi:hypothetical protein
MGKAATLKVTEIEETRRRLEADLRDLEDRLPAPLRSGKAVVGMLLATFGGAFLLRRKLSKGSKGTSPTEVVIRVVREDQEPMSTSKRG